MQNAQHVSNDAKNVAQLARVLAEQLEGADAEQYKYQERLLLNDLSDDSFDGEDPGNANANTAHANDSTRARREEAHQRADMLRLDATASGGKRLALKHTHAPNRIEKPPHGQANDTVLQHSDGQVKGTVLKQCALPLGKPPTPRAGSSSHVSTIGLHTPRDGICPGTASYTHRNVSIPKKPPTPGHHGAEPSSSLPPPLLGAHRPGTGQSRPATVQTGMGSINDGVGWVSRHGGEDRDVRPPTAQSTDSQRLKGQVFLVRVRSHSCLLGSIARVYSVCVLQISKLFTPVRAEARRSNTQTPAHAHTRTHTRTHAHTLAHANHKRTIRTFTLCYFLISCFRKSMCCRITRVAKARGGKGALCPTLPCSTRNRTPKMRIISGPPESRLHAHRIIYQQGILSRSRARGFTSGATVRHSLPAAIQGCGGQRASMYVETLRRRAPLDRGWKRVARGG